MFLPYCCPWVRLALDEPKVLIHSCPQSRPRPSKRHFKSALDEHAYTPAIKVSDEALAGLAMRGNQFHGDTNDPWRLRDHHAEPE